MFFWFAFIIVFLPLSIIFPIKVVGKKNLPKRKKQNVIIACNHMTNADGVMIDVKLKRKFIILGKKELFKNKILGWILHHVGVVSVDRQKFDLGAIKTTLRALNDKKDVCIFPQGTRCKTTEMDKDSIKNGISMFALKTNTPVLPCVYNKPIKPFRRTKLIIGELIYPDENKLNDAEYREEFSLLVVEKMNGLLKENLNERKNERSKS